MRNVISLPDNRKLSYIEAGDKSGKALFYFHGVPSAADEWHLWGDEEKLKSLGIRLIAVDRPGLGLSSFQRDRSICNWSKDISDLADSLKIDKFSVLGYSGGGPYAAVCAALIPDRLISVGLVSSLVSFNNENLLVGINEGNIKFLNLAIQKPALFRFIYWQIALLMKLSPKQYLNNALKTFETADSDVFQMKKVHEAIFAAKGSIKGQQMDTKLILSPWGFNLKDIQVPVYLWQGGKDHNASPAMGKYLENEIPNSIMSFLPEEGHISLIFKNIDQILKKLIGFEE